MYKKYFSELKNRFYLLFLTCFSFMIIGYYYKKVLLFLLLEPNIYKTNSQNYFIFTNVTEIFSVYLKSTFFFSFQIFLLFLYYHIRSFILPSLFIIEYLYLKYISNLILIIWVWSILIFNYFLMPLIWEFFLSFNNNSGVSLYFEAKLAEYLNFYITFYYIVVLYCQIFSFIIFFLNYFNANTVLIKKFRKLFYFFLVLFSTLISPPDIFSQLFISLNMICFFEMLVFNIMLKYSMRLVRE